MKEEFNLSEKRKISQVTEGFFYYPEEDVKEFIRLLKEELNPLTNSTRYTITVIDKLAGEKLI